MGQQQSSQQSNAAQIQKSYYELLDIAKTATEDEIKRAYRRKALELHPDRNYGRVDEVTNLFAEVSAAYEVLSDPQERAWYDNHEDAVLSGNDGFDVDGGVSVTTSEDIAKLYANFSGRNDFTDSASGFYTSLREMFEKLAKEEVLAADIEGTDCPDYPSFGSSQDTYEDVVKPFYDRWAGFATRKTFGWRDIYRLNEAADRRVRRAMEKENKRLRDEGIRDFNDTIRTLVAFVKKRDPRVKSAQMLSDAQRQRHLREQTTAQAARARAANQAKIDKYQEADWVKPAQVPGEEQIDWSEDEQEPEEHFECVVCDKTFKTEKQYEAHERSKKHVQAVKRIQRQMRKEGADLGLDETGEQVIQEKASDVQNEADQENESPTPRKSELEATESNEESTVKPQDDEEEAPNELLAQGDAQTSARTESDSDSLSGASNDDYAPRDVISERLAATADLSLADDDSAEKTETTKKMGRAKEKRARKAAKEATGPAAASDFVCARCSAQFPSKTQLFNHIKKNPSHAQPMPSTNGAKRKPKK